MSMGGFDTTTINLTGTVRGWLSKRDAARKAALKENAKSASSQQEKAKAGQSATAETFKIPGSTGNVRVIPANARGKQWGGSVRTQRPPAATPPPRPQPSRHAGSPSDEGRHMADGTGQHVGERRGRHQGLPQDESNVGKRERPTGKHMKP